jgi:hypothetical protein
MMADFRVVVSWTEVSRSRDGRDVHLSYGKVYPAEDRDQARALLVRARNNNGWAPETAFDVQVDGWPDLRSYDPAPEVTAKGISMMRAALANASGPLVKDLRVSAA